MPSKTLKTSNITLKTYVLLLKRISQGEIDSIDILKGNENRVARELLRSGFISNDSTISEFERQVRSGGVSLAITPKGIAALESWSEQLKSRSFWHKAGDNLLRFLWLVVGAIIASIPKLFE
jgi:hypothetical protein